MSEDKFSRPLTALLFAENVCSAIGFVLLFGLLPAAAVAWLILNVPHLLALVLALVLAVGWVLWICREVILGWWSVSGAIQSSESHWTLRFVRQCWARRPGTYGFGLTVRKRTWIISNQWNYGWFNHMKPIRESE